MSPQRFQGFADGKLHVPLLLGALAFALVLELIFAGSFLGALHSPTPHRLPVAVVGPAPAAEAFAARLSAQSDALHPVVKRDEAALKSAIDNRDVYGGIVLAPDSLRLVVADAASFTAAAYLEEYFKLAASAQGARLTVSHVKALPDGDPRGLSPFYLVLALVFGGYFGATVLSVFGGTSSPSRWRAAGRMVLIAAYAVVSGLLGAVLADPVVGALEGNFLGLAAVSALVVLGAGAATAGLQASLGMAGTAVALVSFILIGNPSSGGPATHEFLPGFWRAVGPWLPGGAGVEAVRNVIYFDGAALGRPLGVLAAYAVVGVTLAVAVGWRRGRAREPEIELASAAAL